MAGDFCSVWIIIYNDRQRGGMVPDGSGKAVGVGNEGISEPARQRMDGFGLLQQIAIVRRFGFLRVYGPVDRQIGLRVFVRNHRFQSVASWRIWRP